MVDTIRERRDGDGNKLPATGREKAGKGTGNRVVNTRDGSKTPYGGMVDGGNSMLVEFHRILVTHATVAWATGNRLGPTYSD